MLIADVLIVIAILATAVIYGTDTVGALVMRPAYAEVDDRTMVQLAGRGHRYGDTRLAPIGITSVVASVLAAVALFVVGRPLAGVLVAVGVVLLLVWLALFARISAPINRVLTAAALADEVPAGARALQERWDSIIVLRAVLQGLAVALFACALFVG